jgi:hypothetical protein
VTHQPGAAEQKTFVPAFIDTISPPRRRRIGRTTGMCGRPIKNASLKPIDRRPTFNHNDADGADPATSSQKSDIAFQRAMRCAVARGLERPPRIGVVKDHRPLKAPRLFEPVPHSSGCTSPALECAELVARND